MFLQSDGTNPRAYANIYEPPVPVIDLTLDKHSLNTSDTLAVTADVLPIDTPFYPFIRLIAPDGRTFYLVRGEGLTASPAPYLRGGPFVLRTAIENYPVGEAAFSGIAPGTYRIEGGAVDAGRTTSPDDVVYIGVVDDEFASVDGAEERVKKLK